MLVCEWKWSVQEERMSGCILVQLQTDWGVSVNSGWFCVFNMQIHQMSVLRYAIVPCSLGVHVTETQIFFDYTKYTHIYSTP